MVAFFDYRETAEENNSVLNVKKSFEIGFMPRRSRRAVEISVPAMSTIARVETINALSVTINRNFSVTQPLWHSSSDVVCTNPLRPAHFEKALSVNYSVLHTVFQATVAAKVSYASPNWWLHSFVQSGLATEMCRIGFLTFRPLYVSPHERFTPPRWVCIKDDSPHYVLCHLLQLQTSPIV